MGQHQSGGVSDLPYATIRSASGYWSAFRIDDRGELLETVERLADGSPDWSYAAICDPVRGDDPELQRAMRIVVASLSQEPDDHPAGSINLDAVARELHKARIQAVVEHSSGNTATLYAGTPTFDPIEGCVRYPVIGGPGHFEGPGWTGARAWQDEFSYGLNDGGRSEHFGVPADASPAEIARQIAAVVGRCSAQPSN